MFEAAELFDYGEDADQAAIAAAAAAVRGCCCCCSVAVVVVKQWRFLCGQYFI
jgi:hypothetical protein